MPEEKKIRKQFDLTQSDVIGLEILAVSKGMKLKPMVELFLHQLAEQAVYDEVNTRLNLENKKQD